MQDPNYTCAPNQNAGGASKIRTTEQSGKSYEGHTGYGFMTNGEDLKTGVKPNPHSLPIAQPIPIMTHGNPGNTSA